MMNVAFSINNFKVTYNNEYTCSDTTLEVNIKE